mmetsp:Transcript_20324/g.30318  ORF Transcript_20324/g.30318 Transcript_20324/m.30318 type:complete len:118 (+) Transcript_20324:1178-1531(+)
MILANLFIPKEEQQGVDMPDLACAPVSRNKRNCEGSDKGRPGEALHRIFLLSSLQKESLNQAGGFLLHCDSCIQRILVVEFLNRKNLQHYTTALHSWLSLQSNIFPGSVHYLSSRGI